MDLGNLGMYKLFRSGVKVQISNQVTLLVGSETAFLRVYKEKLKLLKLK